MLTIAFLTGFRTSPSCCEAIRACLAGRLLRLVLVKPVWTLEADVSAAVSTSSAGHCDIGQQWSIMQCGQNRRLVFHVKLLKHLSKWFPDDYNINMSIILLAYIITYLTTRAISK